MIALHAVALAVVKRGPVGRDEPKAPRYPTPLPGAGQTPQSRLERPGQQAIISIQEHEEAAIRAADTEVPASSARATLGLGEAPHSGSWRQSPPGYPESRRR